jgi:hypothetical protein
VRRAFSTRFLLAVPAILGTSAAHGQGDCPASAGKFCNLNGYLHGLYAVAAVLGVILLVVVVGAIVYYRRAKNVRLEP